MPLETGIAQLRMLGAYLEQNSLDAFWDCACLEQSSGSQAAAAAQPGGKAALR